jgi:hypothetical protein
VSSRLFKNRIGAIRLALDAVQKVERDLLTDGYKAKLPLFHNLFLVGVEKFGGTAGVEGGIRPEMIV